MIILASAFSVAVLTLSAVTSHAQANAQSNAVAASVVASTPLVLPTASATPTAVPNDYKLDVDDTVTIAVMRHGDVGGAFHIPNDGMIRLQRVTTPIDARGKTVADLTVAVTTLLKTEGKLVLHPGQVTVTISAQRVHRAFVRGNAVPGREIDLKPGWRVDDVVALMGGVPQADRLTTVISSPSRSKPIPIDLAAALANPASPENIVFVEGDTMTIDQPLHKRLTIKGEGPKGEHDVDERYGLRATLNSLGFSVVGATGDLHEARLIRNATPGDTSTPANFKMVDLYALLTNDTTPDIPFHDMDTLEIPLSQDYIYILGEIGGPRKWYLPQDRPTHLLDVYANAGDVTSNARMADLKIMHMQADGTYAKPQTYDLTKLLKDGSQDQNPTIKPRDIIFVPSNNRVNPVNSLYTGWSLFGIARALVPFL